MSRQARMIEDVSNLHHWQQQGQDQGQDQSQDQGHIVKQLA